jgi:hypothetical protein
MRNTLDTIPHELLENIALFAVTSDPLGPPRELVPLLLANKHLYAALASASNPHLYARIFAAKFDTAALVRRLGPGTSANTTTGTTATTTSTGGGATKATKLAAELKRRCVQLKRLRTGVGCMIGAFATQRGGVGVGVGAGEGGGGGGLTEEGIRALHEMLWTAYLMMLENDGKNERQLREYARLDRWLRKFWFAEDGASCAQIAIRDNAWPPNNDLSALTMWLFWFLLRPGPYFLFSAFFCPHIILLHRRSLIISKLTVYTLHHNHAHLHPFAAFPGPIILRYRTNLPAPFLLTSPPFVVPRVDGAFSAYHVHMHTTCTHTTRGVLCAGRRRVPGRNFHIEVAGSWRTSGMSCLRVSSFAYDCSFFLDLFLPSFPSSCVFAVLFLFFIPFYPLYFILFSLLPARRSLGSTVLATREAWLAKSCCSRVCFGAQDARASL